MIRRLASVMAAIVLVVGCLGPALAEGPVNMTRGGGAVQGYDTVAYHTMAAAVPGDPQFTAEWLHATWYFVSAENRDLFVADPDKYLPAYGGYCAFAVAQGVKVGIDPAAWTIFEGRLYLNESDLTRKAWQKDTPYYIGLADRHWAKIKFE